MKYIKLNNFEIPYKIAKKKNKNTYFYFKKDGYIQINLSKYQSEQDAIYYIKQHSETFINKLTKNTQINRLKENEFLYQGVIYQTILQKDSEIYFDEKNKLVYLPTTEVNSKVVKQFLKQEMMRQIMSLHQRYKDNPYVSLEGVTYQTRFTTSRHGSCNARKRNINLNLHLIQYPLIYLEYVYLHEIAHLKHQNHGKEFYNLLQKLCPNYQILRKELRKIYR